MKIIKKIGKKTLTLVFMLAFVITTSYFSYALKNISLLTFILISVAAVVLITLNVLERKEEIKKEVVSFLEKADDAIRECQLKSALRCYDEALFLDPKSFKAQVGKGRCRRILTEYSKAIDEFKIALDMEIDQKTEAEIHYFIGACMMEQGNRKEADLEFSKTIKLDPHFNEVLPYVAELKHFAGDNDEAFRLLEKYLAKCPRGRRESIIDRMAMFDPNKVKKYTCEGIVEDEETAGNKADSVIKRTGPESTDEKSKSVKNNKDEGSGVTGDEKPADAGYSNDDFVLPTYMKREETLEASKLTTKTVPRVSVTRTATVDEVMSSEPVDAAPVSVPEALAEKPPVPAAPKPFVPSALETASTEPFVPSVIKTATVDEVMSSEPVDAAPVSVPEALAEKPPVPAAPKPFVPSALETASTEPFVPSVIKTATVDEVMSSEPVDAAPVAVPEALAEKPPVTGCSQAFCALRSGNSIHRTLCAVCNQDRHC